MAARILLERNIDQHIFTASGYVVRVSGGRRCGRGRERNMRTPEAASGEPQRQLIGSSDKTKGNAPPLPPPAAAGTYGCVLTERKVKLH